MKTRLVVSHASARSYVLVSPTSGGAGFGVPARVRTTGVPTQAFIPTAGVFGDLAGPRTWSPPIT